MHRHRKVNIKKLLLKQKKKKKLMGKLESKIRIRRDGVRAVATSSGRVEPGNHSNHTHDSFQNPTT